MDIEHDYDVEVLIQDTKLPINPFVQEIIAKMNIAVLESLKKTDNLENISIQIKKSVWSHPSLTNSLYTPLIEPAAGLHRHLSNPLSR